MNTRGVPNRQPEVEMKGSFEIMDAQFAAGRPRRFSNLGIDFLDDPDNRPGIQATYHANHAESYVGDKEHHNADMQNK
ncbi:hypothetical protein CcaverHIS002_0600570 [Cutaneotrichosporon cavernicola]|uniref:Uncharacterized protein n=1 Tax=Cutaneotrichosporon cavernicola TaxID=279322 RepID=A0AA48L5Q6_9TREE|nr:uncharacterized protein CcaverHIS019_0500660 [Cutaneotrichosporon cavernicola]BEI85770.1 hypothetical protein CcaverHIS002_0600570 [Cutaneotrichosporon cavernicola]BEI92438.1 hypothetical protein CcaverHIS019_0500660 [Cutaneotrichosporon cavernicola]BEJ00211.1 hypothetical protein CcaverHIS631_0500680 [Cutaneotrichosporon cavernicola]BEJ07982.1 hypothetical protein CcaverHIS641_0500670 [Cutaneotrichosporon cavernicola]